MGKCAVALALASGLLWAQPAGGNRFYAGNREPLLPSPLIRLPLGAVTPRGWLRHQLELMAAGFTGHLTEISKFCRFQGNAWTHPNGAGQFGWEEAPYWLRGYYDLGWLLQDRRILAEANRWIDAVLATQRPDGYFGSQANLERPAPDLWPNMVMLFPIRSLYEATGDARVLPFMLKYFRWQTTIPLHEFVPASWQHWRAGDNLDSIYWLYNRTGERWLLDLARVNHERTADWVGGIPTWHVVNFAECFREPGQFYQQARDVRYRRATERDYDTMRGLYGQVPGGMYGADENARPGFSGPRQGTETCGFAEMLYSDELLLSITGNPLWADRAEEIAFNSLPASMTPDLKGLHYLTAPNQIQLDSQNKAPLIDNPGDMFSYNPYQYRCCQHNVAFAWPYFVRHLWMATQGNGLAAVMYAPNEVKAKVGDGTEVSIAEETDYPFGESVAFAIAAPRPTRFPLRLRIPGWCRRPQLMLNGKPLPFTGRRWAVLDRTWSPGDRLELRLPAEVTTTVWTKNRNTVSVNRGPLTFSLKIGERWEKKGGTEEWPGYEVYPTTPWNYGLAPDGFEVLQGKRPLPAQPFALDAAPILLRAHGRRIPEWKQEPNGMVGEVQPGPVRSDQPLEEITLVPMGCARLRISAFPQIGEGSWRENVPVVLASSASHFDPPTLVNDGDTNTRFSFADHRGTCEWIEYDYSRPRRFASSAVWWTGPPQSWKLLWWDGNAWQAVNAGAYETRTDAFNRVRFTPVEARRLRLQVQLREGAGAGITEWNVFP